MSHEEFLTLHHIYSKFILYPFQMSSEVSFFKTPTTQLNFGNVQVSAIGPFIKLLIGNQNFSPSLFILASHLGTSARKSNVTTS